jgi:hypothetical protein
MAEKDTPNSSRKYAIVVIAGVAAAIGIGLVAAYYMEPEGEFVAGTIQEGRPFAGPDTTVTDPLGVPPEPADDAARLPNPFAGQEEEPAALSLRVSSSELGDREMKQVAIAGNGFTPNEQVVISIDQRAVEMGEQIMTDDAGTFSADVTLPAEIADDEVTITATDESGKVASDTIDVNT